MIKRTVKHLLRQFGYDVVAYSASNAEDTAYDVDLCGPPNCPPDLNIGAPDFVGIGAQRSGTSWWYDVLTQHPDIYHPEFMADTVEPGYLVKERHYFDRFFFQEFKRNNIKEYYEWFPRPEGCITGEWTPRYLVDPWVAPLLHKCAPDIKILVILRDPIDRFISGMSLSRRYGQLDPGRAVENFNRGLYWLQLSRWLKYFNKDQFLVFQYEYCVEKPREALKKTYKFLGVDDNFTTEQATIQKIVNKTRTGTEYDMPASSLEEFAQRYIEDANLLVKEFPHIDLSKWRSLKKIN